MEGGSATHKDGARMITLTRLSGSVFALNSDLIERVDATPDTVVTLVDGKKYVVTESLEEIVDSVRRHRGEVLALSTCLESDAWGPAPSSTPPRLGTVSEHPASRGRAGRVAGPLAGTDS
jgi:flagellar protein FlbD